jgi:hypothetical protein
MKKPPELSKAEIAKRVDEQWRRILQENGLAGSSKDLKQMLKAADIPIEERLAHGLTIGAAIGLGGLGEKVASMVKSQEDLDRLFQEMSQFGDKAPSMLRKAFKDTARTLPRKGGPGRSHKLDLREATLMCDEIASIIRQQNISQKQALRIASERSPKLLSGKTVGARTLWEVWNNRDKLTAIYGAQSVQNDKM